MTAEEQCLPGELDMTGQTLVVPCGPGHKGRTLYELSAAERTAEARAKTMTFTSSIQRFGGRFAVGTSKSVPGWFGGFDFGKKRAAWKVKGDEPGLFAAEPGCARGVISWLDGVHTVHELVKGKEVDSFQTARSRGLAMSADTIATIDVKGNITLRRDGANSVVERDEPTEYGNLPLAFTEDGQHLLVGASDGSVEIRDAADGALRRTLVLHAGPFKDLRVAGGKLFSLGTDGALKVVSL
ncbi:MAG: hypothetical protein CMN30_11340 [Sandaracinus sp.]|nr:hypothetical protein [Sandaracinus sp.]